MEMTMYDNLLQLPLFQGLCKDDFTSIIERVKFHFLTLKDGETIARQGEACRRLIFLLNGSISALTTDDDRSFALSETISAPYVIEPHSLFGGKTVYTSTYKAKSETKLLCIDKQYIYTQLNNYEIFRLNYLNILSNKYQQSRVKLWQTRFGQLEEKLATFLLNRCLQPYGEKTLQITMDDLGKLIGETRINVSKVLNEMQKKELVQLKRKEIYIPEFGKLTDGLLEQI